MGKMSKITKIILIILAFLCLIGLGLFIGKKIQERNREKAQKEAVELSNKRRDIVLEYMNNVEDKIDKYIGDKELDTLKEYAQKEVAIMYDFIYYGKEIKDVKYNTLIRADKNILKKKVRTIDDKVNKVIADYKKDIETDNEYSYDKLEDFLELNIDQANKNAEFFTSIRDSYKGISNQIQDETGKKSEENKEKAQKIYDSFFDWYIHKDE